MIHIVHKKLNKYDYEILLSVLFKLKRYIKEYIEIVELNELKYNKDDILLITEDIKDNKSKFIKDIEKVINYKIEDIKHIIIERPKKIIENYNNKIDIINKKLLNYGVATKQPQELDYKKIIMSQLKDFL